MSLFKKKNLKKEESETPNKNSLALALNVQNKNRKPMAHGGKTDDVPYNKKNAIAIQKGVNSDDPIVKGVKKLFGFGDKEENYAEGGEVESSNDVCHHCSGIGYLTQNLSQDNTESELPNSLESHQPMDSNQHGDMLEDSDENNKDSISKIMKKMKNK
jgi:hypothetical protein